jgi:hypothetical protein
MTCSIRMGRLPSSALASAPTLRSFYAGEVQDDDATPVSITLLLNTCHRHMKTCEAKSTQVEEDWRCFYLLLDNGRRVDTFESQTSSCHHSLRDLHTYRTLVALATASSTIRPGNSEHVAAPCYHDDSRGGFLSPKGSKPRLMTTPFLLTNRCIICVRSF